MKDNILSLFLDNGFIKENEKTIEKKLFDDFRVVVTCEEGWIEDEFVTFYIYASRFTPFIQSIFALVPEAKLIQPKKFNESKLGCLCMASTTIERVNNEWKVWLYGEETKLIDVLRKFSEAQCLERFYDLIYIKINRYFVWVETIWVYLFLNKLLGRYSVDDLYEDISQKKMSAIVKRWGMNSKPSKEQLAEILKIETMLH